MTTFIPASWNTCACPRPMPLEPPVMKATLPVTSFIGAGPAADALAAAALPEPAPRRLAAPAAIAMPPRKSRRSTPCLSCAMESPPCLTEMLLHTQCGRRGKAIRIRSEPEYRQFPLTMIAASWLGMRLPRSIRVFMDAIQIWMDRNAYQHASALAFYTLFSLAPLVIILVAIVGFVYGHDAAAGRISAGINDLVGSQAATAIEDA